MKTVAKFVVAVVGEDTVAILGKIAKVIGLSAVALMVGSALPVLGVAMGAMTLVVAVVG